MSAEGHNLRRLTRSQAFESAPAWSPEAKRIANRLEIHHTLKHGSWLNMAEIELGVLSGQCLDRRIPDQLALKRCVALWQTKRNQAQVTVDWYFTTPMPVSNSSVFTRRFMIVRPLVMMPIF